ncbi:hypothetical protein DRO33_00570 [Candidatus Bathyarchaeota archaeon]|nr:MAG: hypothetical protein DRO33_00570 [Candidatus Bathyarchaeota archaeon]
MGDGRLEDRIRALSKELTPMKFPFYRLSTCLLAQLLLMATPIGWFLLARSALRLFRGRELLKALLAPLYLSTLSNLSVRRIGPLLFCWQPLWGLRLLLPDLEGIYRYYHIWLREDYEKVAGPGEGDIVIDAGAHVGLFTLKCLRIHKACLVVAVEPHPLNAKLLRSNMVLNGLEGKVAVVEAALGSEEGKGRLYLARVAGRHSLVQRHGGRSIPVEVITIDGLVRGLGLERVDFIKVDVEGAELDVLRAAGGTLSRFRPTLVIEARVDRLRELVDLLRPYGYEFFVLPCEWGGWVHLTALPRHRLPPLYSAVA